MRVILQADQRPKQNHKDEILPAHPQELYLLGKEIGPMLNQENILSPIMKCRRNWFIFFVIYCHHWSDDKWKSSMARRGGNKKRFQYCTDLSGAILYLRALHGNSGGSLIDPTLHDNRTVSSNSFIMSDVQSIYIPSSIQDWHREVKIWATDR